MILPGPEAQQLATYIGWLMHRTWGGIVAGALFVLPSLLILILLSWLYIAYGDLHWVEGLFYGIKPAVTAIVIQAAHRIGSRVLKNAWLWTIALAAFAAIAVLRLPFPLIVLAAAIVGFAGSRLAPAMFRVGAGHGAASGNHAPLRSSTTTRPYRRMRASAGSGCCASPSPACCCGPFPWQFCCSSSAGTTCSPGMGWFFTKAAWLTFGGAYAVLPYVYQGAVDQHAWLTPQQMIDGLALGETTPGPLIMVVAFVGFVGGYAKAWLGAQSLFLAGAIAAIVVTWFTFLPSFLLILGGGPLVESTQNQIRVTAPLTAITAAVVGVIANLAVFFAWHVFWPAGLHGSVDWISVAMAMAAAIALLRFRQGVVAVILVCALVGLAVTILT